MDDAQARASKERQEGVSEAFNVGKLKIKSSDINSEMTLSDGWHSEEEIFLRALKVSPSVRIKLVPANS